MSTFGEAFRGARLDRLKSVSDVANNADIGESLIEGIEEGTITPLKGTALRMIEGLDLYKGSGMRQRLTAIAKTLDGKELTDARASSTDSVNHPQHYINHPSGVECIQIAEHMGFNLGNAVKYLWRADEKGHDIEDLQKAAWYIQREIERRGAENQ